MKPDREFNEPLPGSQVTRREFLKFTGSGILIFFTVGELPFFRQESEGKSLSTDFNAFLKIGVDGRVSCFTGKIEMGQGIITSLAQILAEELDVSLHAIDMVMGDTDQCPWDMGTFGSMTIKYFGPSLRAAAAEAKAVLIQLAAEQLHLPADQLKVKDGIVADIRSPHNKVSYANLAKGKRVERRLDHEVSLKPISEYTVSGKPIPRTDALEKVTGSARYAGDIRLPGMLYAKILRPPAHGASLSSVDTSEVEKTKGIKIVRESDFIAILHPHPDVAEEALARVKAKYEIPKPEVDDKTIFDYLSKKIPQGETVAQEGRIEAGKRLSSVLFDETYFTRYVAHAPIETHTAVAKMEKGKVTVWVSTQRPFGDRERVARDLGLPAEDVRIITPFVGGGFGGKTRNRQAVEAARLTQMTGKPVQVAWSREEEFYYDTFQPAAMVTIKSGLDSLNQVTFWDYTVYFAGSRESHVFYAFPHIRTVSHGGWYRGGSEAHPFAIGAWRAPSCNTNTFARESHMDQMAAKAGIDPLRFRLSHLKDQRMKRVLETAADRFGWAAGKAPSGRGCGVACGTYRGTYVAVMAEIEMNGGSRIRVKRMICAQDLGRIINPEGARLQMEGCMMMGLGYALSEEIRFTGGEIHDVNYDTYEIPRFSWLPKIETELIDNPSVAPQGGGEPPITCVGAVIANALFDATGVRLQELPMTPERIRKAKEKDESPKKAS